MKSKRKPKSKAPSPGPAATLASEQAAIMLQANQRNIAKKLQDGGTLTAHETRELEALGSGRKFRPDDLAGGMSQAAAILGTSRDVVRAAKKAGCLAFRQNNNVHVPTLREWLKEHNVEPDKSEGKSVSDARYARARADRAEIVVSVQKRNLIPVEVMRRSFTRAVVAFKTRLLAISDNISQRYAVMTDPIAIYEDHRKLVNDALAELSKCEWYVPEPEPEPELEK